MSTNEPPKEIRVKSTPVFKLKDKPLRQFQSINLVKQFGFLPDVIIIEKVRGMNNVLIVRAVLTDEEMQLEDLRIKSSQPVKNGKQKSNIQKGK